MTRIRIQKLKCRKVTPVKNQRAFQKCKFFQKSANLLPKMIFYEKSRKNHKKSKMFRKNLKFGPLLFGYITTLQKQIQIKIPSRLKDMIKSFKSSVSLSL